MQTKGQLKLKLSSGVGGSICSVPEEGLSAVLRDLQVGLQGRWKHVIIFGSNTRLKFSEIPRGSSRLWEPKALDFFSLICLLARIAMLSFSQGIWSASDSFEGSQSSPARCFRAESHPCITSVTVPCYQLFLSLLGCSRPLISYPTAATTSLVF